MAWLAATVAAAFVAFVALAYSLRWHWTGFPAVPAVSAEIQERPAKTVWDWLQLLGIPVALAALAFLLNSAQSRRDQQREDQRASQARVLATDAERESTLGTYLARMSDLTLDRGLLHSKPRADVREVARTATLTAVRRLDGARKGLVVRFLAEARLITRHEGGTDGLLRVASADLTRADLRAAKLSGVDLSDGNFRAANLSDADLVQADLNNASLIGADLSYADLAAADLTNAKLDRADLTGADFLGTDLTSAELRMAHLREAHLGNSNLSWANLMEADLSGAHLILARLTNATLTGADLSRADLSHADLSHAEVSEADLRGASLDGANLTGANLLGADLRGARGVILKGSRGKPAHMP